MRGIGHTLSRLPTARAFLAGAAILAGAFTSAAHGQTSGLGNGTGTLTPDAIRADEAAWAVPRVPHGSAPGVAVSAAAWPERRRDHAAYIRLSGPRGCSRGVRAAAGLEDPLLLGTSLADRYLGRRHRSTPDELSDWLARYPDLPDAPAIHALLLHPAAEGRDAARRAGGQRCWSKPPMRTCRPEDIDPPRSDLVRAIRHLTGTFWSVRNVAMRRPRCG